MPERPLNYDRFEVSAPMPEPGDARESVSGSGSSLLDPSGTDWVATAPEEERAWTIQLVLQGMLGVGLAAVVGYVLFLVRPFPAATAIALFALAVAIGLPILVVYYYRLNFVTRVGITTTAAIFQFRARQFEVAWDDVRPLPSKARRSFSHYWFRCDLRRGTKSASSLAIAVTEAQARALLNHRPSRPG